MAAPPGQSMAAEHNVRGVQLCEQGQLDLAIDCFREAIRLDRTCSSAHYNLGNALLAAGRNTQACTAYRDALALDPCSALGLRNLGLALLAEDELDAAVDALRRAIEFDPESAEARSALAIALLRRGDVRDALIPIRHNLQRVPGATRDLALEAVALERLGDERAGQMLDFERLVVMQRVTAPVGYPNLEVFNAALMQHIFEHPSLMESPAQHATRGGRHSGELLDDCTPIITALESMIEDSVHAYVQVGLLPAAHPFLASVPDKVQLTAWAVVLERRGYQIPHIHPTGWLSGVYYVRVPATLSQRSHEGAIEFGRPERELCGSRFAATHLLRPESGSIVMFPSYIYHRTLPFEAPDVRISVAFDVIPDTA